MMKQNYHDNNAYYGYNDTTQMELLHQIWENGFAVDDIALYLDTHPDDPQAMEYYRYVLQNYNDAVNAYETAYGPLTYTQVTSDSWDWVNGPWPWEGGM